MITEAALNALKNKFITLPAAAGFTANGTDYDADVTQSRIGGGKIIISMLIGSSAVGKTVTNVWLEDSDGNAIASDTCNITNVTADGYIYTFYIDITAGEE